jgi:hypothetical protein
MKHLLLIFIICCTILPVFASNIIIVDSATATNKFTTIAIPSNATVKQLLGRKLTFKEKLGLFLARAKYKNGVPIDTLEAQKANSTAVWGFVLSILGYFFFPLLVPGYILSNNVLKKEKAHPGLLTSTNKTLAQIGKIFPIVYGVLLIIFLMIMALIIIRVGWY